jgi:ketosteroid isomerase-like protein
MAQNEPRQLVERLWSMFDSGDFDVGALLHDDFVCEWPQSGECIRGRDNFIAINANYPRRVRIDLLRALTAGDTVVTEIAATDPDDPTRVDRAVSFFDFRDGRIVHLREFWPDPFEAAAWRAQWVERSGPSGEVAP